MAFELIERQGYNAKLKVVINSGDFSKYCMEAYKKNKSQFSLPGFRKGKVPKVVIEKNYGKEIFYDDALNMALNTEYPEAIKALDIKPVAQPKIDVEDIKEGQDVVITMEVVIEPDFELGQYKGLDIEKEVKKATEEDINKELEARQNQNARFITIEDRPVQDKDIVKLDYEGKVDGVAFAGGSAKDHTLTIGSGQFIPGFEEQLIGMKLNEEKDITVTFPEEYHSKELEGKEAVFTVKINEIKEKQLPEIDDEFVKDISEFDTLDQLKEDIEREINKHNAEHAKNDMENSLIEKIVENSTFDLPQEMIENQIDAMLQETDRNMRYQGIDLNSFLKFTGKSMEEFRKEMQGEAEKRVKGNMVLEKIKKQDNIGYSEDQVAKELDEMASVYGTDREKIEGLLRPEDKEYIIDNILMRNTINYLVAENNIIEKEI